MNKYSPSKTISKLSKYHLSVLKEYCPYWVNRLSTSDTWADVLELKDEFPLKSLTSFNSCMVGECMGGNSSYRDRDMIQYNSELKILAIHISSVATRLGDYECDAKCNPHIMQSECDKFIAFIDKLASLLIKGVDYSVKFERSIFNA